MSEYIESNNVLQNKFPSNWPNWFCEVVLKLNTDIQIKLIIYGRTGK